MATTILSSLLCKIWAVWEKDELNRTQQSAKEQVTFCLLQLVVPAVAPAPHGLLTLNAPLHGAQPEDKDAGVFSW